MHILCVINGICSLLQQTLERSYLLKINGKGEQSLVPKVDSGPRDNIRWALWSVKSSPNLVFSVVAERPQHMLMRVAVGIHQADIDAAIETYNLLSERWFTHASPTLFNAGTDRSQLSRWDLSRVQRTPYISPTLPSNWRFLQLFLAGNEGRQHRWHLWHTEAVCAHLQISRRYRSGSQLHQSDRQLYRWGD